MKYAINEKTLMLVYLTLVTFKIECQGRALWGKMKSKKKYREYSRELRPIGDAYAPRDENPFSSDFTIERETLTTIELPYF